MGKLDYNSINFRNKDIDKMAGKFGNGDPLKKDYPNDPVRDSVMMSKGYTPRGGGWYNNPAYKPTIATLAQMEKMKKAAAESNPSKGYFPSNTPKANAAIALEEANKKSNEKAKPGPRK